MAPLMADIPQSSAWQMDGCAEVGHLTGGLDTEVLNMKTPVNCGMAIPYRARKGDHMATNTTDAKWRDFVSGIFHDKWLE